MDFRGGFGVSSRITQIPQRLSTISTRKKKIKKEWMSDYQRKLADELKVEMSEEKLVLTLQDKENYVLHYKHLQQYLKLGMKLKN